MTAFEYKQGNSFLHKIPAWCKIIFIPLLNIAVFKMPVYVSLVFLCVQILTALLLHFTVCEIFNDFFPVLFYAIILYSTNFIASWCGIFFSAEAVRSFSNALWFAKLCAQNVFLNLGTAKLLLKLFCIIQGASLVFRTSTSLQIREGVACIEGAVRKVLPVSKKNRFANTLSLFICFIPLVFKNWRKCKRAWIARGGHHNLKMYRTLFPVFFSVGIKQSYNMARAISARSVSL